MTRILSLLSIGAWFLLLWPFPVTTFLATSMACVSYPYFFKLTQKVSRYWAVVIYTICLSILILLPLTITISLIIPQAVAGLKVLDQLREPGFLQSINADQVLDSMDMWLKEIPGLEGGIKQLASSIAGIVGSITRSVLAGGLGIAGGAFHAVLTIFIFIMVTVLCITNAELLYAMIRITSNFSYEMLNRFIVTIRNAIFGVLVGIVLVSIIQGFLCGIGFAVANVPQPAFWGLITAFVAPIPFVGTSLVWIPVCIWLWLQGETVAMIAMIIWCVIVVAGVDNLLRPFFLKTGIDATLIALILSILCGLAAFGPVGIVAGPILVAIAIQASKESLQELTITDRNCNK